MRCEIWLALGAVDCLIPCVFSEWLGGEVYVGRRNRYLGRRWRGADDKET